MPTKFVTFVRTPYLVAFEIPAANKQPPLRFTAVNAHLVFGKPIERENEFNALIGWLIHRLKSRLRVTPNFVLLGDLNLNFDDPSKDRARIDDSLRERNKQAFGDKNIRRLYFPFLDPHPVTGEVFRTNARATQTYDQIGFFLGRKQPCLPNDQWRKLVKKGGPDNFDYGVFKFSDLFARATLKKPYGKLTKSEEEGLGKKFEHSVSDHLPIWVRIPRPGFAPPPVL